MTGEAWVATGFGKVEAAADKLEDALTTAVHGLHMNAPTSEEVAILKRDVDAAFKEYAEALIEWDEHEYGASGDEVDDED